MSTLCKTSGLTIERIWKPDPQPDDPPDPPPEDPPDPPPPFKLPVLPTGWYWGCYKGGTSSSLGEQLYSYFVWNYSGSRTAILFEGPYVAGTPIMSQ